MFNSSERTQTGAVLIISLIMLLLMTIIGVAAMRTTVLEEKMAGNLRDLNLAFDASESALRVGEMWIDDLMSKPDPTASCTTSCGLVIWNFNALDPLNVATTWNTAKVRTAYGSMVIPVVAAQPGYYVEHQEFVKDSLNMGLVQDNVGRDLYLVTARGTGGAATTQAIVRTTYARRF